MIRASDTMTFYFVLSVLAILCTQLQLVHPLPLRRSLPPSTPERTNQTASTGMPGTTTNSGGGNETEEIRHPCTSTNATGNDTLGESDLNSPRNDTKNGSQLCSGVHDNRTRNIEFDCDCERAEVPPTARWSVLLGLFALKDYSTDLYASRAENFVACLEPARHRTPGAFHSRPEQSHPLVAKWMRVFQSYARHIANVVTRGGVSPTEERQLVSLYQILSGILNEYAIVVS